MRTLGLIGGTSWVSTVDYYRLINQQINEALGGLNSAKILMYSMNYEEFKPPTDPDKWGPLADTLSGIALRLEKAGADCIMLCANTPHMAADIVRQRIGVPLLHIADATAAGIKHQGLHRVGLLGTRITMEQGFFKDRLLQQGINTLIPEAGDREYLHKTIFNELGRGLFLPEIKERYLDIIRGLAAKGAEGIIFGCTEIPLLIKPGECPVPVFDTMLLHTRAAVAFALQDSH